VTKQSIRVAVLGPEIVSILFRNSYEEAQRFIHGICIRKRAGHIRLKSNHITKTLTPRSKLADS